MTAPTSPAITEDADAAHYFLAPFVLSADTDSEPALEVQVFARADMQASFVDLRDPAATTGYALVRTSMSPAQVATALGEPMPATVIHVGQSLTAPLPTAKRTEVRAALNLRGQIATVKDVLRFMLLTEAGANGKPGKLQPEPNGGLFVYLGDLAVDLRVSGA